MVAVKNTQDESARESMKGQSSSKVSWLSRSRRVKELRVVLLLFVPFLSPRLKLVGKGSYPP